MALSDNEVTASSVGAPSTVGAARSGATRKTQRVSAGASAATAKPLPPMVMRVPPVTGPEAGVSVAGAAA